MNVHDEIQPLVPNPLWVKPSNRPSQGHTWRFAWAAPTTALTLKTASCRARCARSHPDERPAPHFLSAGR